MNPDSNLLIEAYNAKSVLNKKPQTDSPMGGKMLKMYNLLADNQLQYLYPPLEKRSISVEGLVKLSRDYDFITIMKKLCKIKQRDAVRLMGVVVKYISTEYAAGRQIDDDFDVATMMENRAKNRLPRYEEDDELKLSERAKRISR